MPSRQRAAATITGAAGGAFAGLTGVGGGAIMIPLLTGLLGLPQRLAHGTSLAILLFVGAAGFLVYALVDVITWELIPLLALGSMTGGVIGARYLQQIPEFWLSQLFAAYLLAIGIRMLVA